MIDNNHNTRLVEEDTEDTVVSDDEADEDFLKRKEKNKKKDTVMIEVPRDIVKILAPTASRYDVSSTALSSILLQTVSAGGGDINSLPLSRRQVERSSNVSISQQASSIKEIFKNIAKNMFFICHFDGSSYLSSPWG